MGHENRLASSKRVVGGGEWGGGWNFKDCSHPSQGGATPLPWYIECKTAWMHLTCQSMPTWLTYLRGRGNWKV